MTGFRTTVPWYFAYGSNMNPARMAARAITTRRALAGTIPGLRMVFDKRGKLPGEGHANLIFAPLAVVEGVLYELSSEDELRKLDRFERTPINYSRELLSIRSSEGCRSAWVYLANPGARSTGLLPSQAYLQHLQAGYAYLSPAYRQRLADQAVLPGAAVQ